MTDQLQAVTALLTRARRRHLAQLILEQAGIALGAAFAGTVLLLLLGTQILDWYWLVLLFVVTFGYGIWRTVRRVPSRYRLAQIIDERMQLHDTLSTAYVYAGGGRRASPGLVEYECGQAEQMARRVDPRSVFPMRMPKALYAVAGVALVAFGMFAIRYGVTHSLDLKPSLVKIAFESVWNTDKNAPEKKSAFQKKLEEQLRKMGIDLGSPDAERPLDGAPESALNTIDTPNVNNSDSNESVEARAATAKERQEPGEGEGAAKGEGSGGDKEDGAGDQPPTSQSNSPGKQDGPQKNANSQQNGEKNSLMDRMRDAMANMLNKLNLQPKGGQSQQQSAQNSGQKSGQKQSQGQKGSQQQAKQDSNGSESQDQQGQPQGQGQQSESAQGKAGDKGAEKQASNDSKSGMGKDDGDKSAREAEQLAAMGKISEILGKRAQNLSGELMVEVAGGNQQLKTAYSGKVGTHAEAGGEITRDEVPMMYRDFVQQYFEQVRRIPPPSVAKPKAAEVVTGKKASKVTE